MKKQQSKPQGKKVQKTNLSAKKRQEEKTQSSQWPQWILLAVIAIGAAGAGITGTLLWMQSRAPAPGSASTVQAPLPGAPGVAGSSAEITPDSPNDDRFHEPPPTLTVGMSPAQTAVTLGNWYYDHERWDVAIEQYNKAISAGMDNPNVRTDLGNCYRFVHKPREALEQYLRAQEQDPKHEQSLFNQGGLYAFSMGQPEKAIEIWNEYLKKFPNGQSVREARRLIDTVKTQKQ